MYKRAQDLLVTGMQELRARRDRGCADFDERIQTLEYLLGGLETGSMAPERIPRRVKGLLEEREEGKGQSRKGRHDNIPVSPSGAKPRRITIGSNTQPVALPERYPSLAKMDAQGMRILQVLDRMLLDGLFSDGPLGHSGAMSALHLLWLRRDVARLGEEPHAGGWMSGDVADYFRQLVQTLDNLRSPEICIRQGVYCRFVRTLITRYAQCVAGDLEAGSLTKEQIKAFQERSEGGNLLDEKELQALWHTATAAYGGLVWCEERLALEEMLLLAARP